MAYLPKQEDIPKLRSFSLGDFHDFERCSFSFFVRHHLEKKYELEEGSAVQTIGSLLDLAIKKFQSLSPLQQSMHVIPALISSAAAQIRDEVQYNKSQGRPRSFYSSQLVFLTPEVVQEATQVFQDYYRGVKGKIKKAIHKNRLKPFWKFDCFDGQSFRLWGGADAIELGGDNIPEVIDYKYYPEGSKSKDFLDLDLMSKLYVLLCAKELQEGGFSRARFKIRLWTEPADESLYEEFDLSSVKNLAEYFGDKVRRILGVTTLSFCDKPFCKVCQSEQRPAWIRELIAKGWIEKLP